MPASHKRYEGACHCGKVRFCIDLENGFSSVRRCNCSYCRMRGAITVSAHIDAFELLGGQDELTLYQFHSLAAKHWFCATCGIYTHHIRRSAPNRIGVNVACLDGISPFDFAEVEVVDGVNHPNDTGGVSRTVGILRFQRVE